MKYMNIHSACMCAHVRTQSSLTLCSTMETFRLLCPWIFHARTLEWVTISSSRASSQPRDRTLRLLHCREILNPLSHWGRWVV